MVRGKALQGQRAYRLAERHKGGRLCRPEYPEYPKDTAKIGPLWHTTGPLWHTVGPL